MPAGVNFQPGHGTAGRHPTREFLDSLSGHDDPGMFGRMFPQLDPLAVADGPLHELADAMKDATATDPSGDNPNIPGNGRHSLYFYGPFGCVVVSELQGFLRVGSRDV
jgi:hypothetical protein